MKLKINRFIKTEPIETDVITNVEVKGADNLIKIANQLKSANKNMKMSSAFGDMVNEKEFEKATNFMTQLRTSVKAMSKDKSTKLVDPSGFGTVSGEIDKLKNSLKDISPDTLSKLVMSSVSGAPVERLQKFNSIMSIFNNTAKDTNSTLEQIEGASNKAGTGLQHLAKVVRGTILIQIQALYHVLRRAFSFLTSSFTAAGDFVESMNLYTMSVGEYAVAGKKWAEEIADALYLDTSEIYQYTGQFYNLTRGLGVTAEAADLMSRNLTQLTYDMSSYLNIDVNTANTKLMSAMSGQTKAVTSVGIAVQSASLQELAWSLNIKKSVEEMTQAEKTYLRYIQIMRSTTQMQGDLGRTIITPTNAMRLLRTQMNLLSRAIGQVFTPIIMRTIPYIIAFTQVLTELAQTLAKSMGYKLEDYLAPASSVKAIANGFGDLDEEAKKAGKSINRTLAPFDELNVVEMQSKNKGAGDGVSVADDLQQYLEGYDMLEFYTSQMKDKIEDIKKKIKTIGPIIAAAFGLGIIGKFLNKLGKVKTGFLNLKNPLSSIGDFVKKIYGLEGNKRLSEFTKKIKTATSKFGEMLGKISKIAIGLVGVYDGSKRIQSSVKDLTVGTDKVVSSFAKLALGVGETVGAAALLGSAFNKTGLGAAVGVVIALTDAFIGFQKGLEEAKEKKLAEEIFGTMHTTADEFKKTLEESGPIVDEYMKKIDASNETISKAKDAYKENEDAIDSYAYKVGTLGQTVGDEFETNVKPKLNQMFTDAKTIITEEGNAAKEILVQSFKTGTDLSIDEQNRLLKDIDENTTWAQNKIDATQTRINEIYSTASKERRGLTTDEINEIQTLLDKMDELTLKKVTDSELKLYQASKKGKDKRYQLDLDSYTEFNNALNDYIKEQQTINDRAYLEEKNKLEYQANLKRLRNIELYGDEKKAYEEYLVDMAKAKEIADANDKKRQDELERYVKESKDNVLADITQMWKDLYEETDTKSLQERQLIEKIFNKIDPEKLKGLREQMAEEGKTDGKELKLAMMKEMQSPWAVKTEAEIKIDAKIKSGQINVDELKNELQSGVNKAASRIQLPTLKSDGSGFQFKAAGGFVDTGELFVAREAGPELVGKIGNKTAVANNDQITTAMTNAMIVALNGANNNRQPIHNTVYIGSEKVYNGMGNYIDSQNDRYGTNYVKV